MKKLLFILILFLSTKTVISQTKEYSIIKKYVDRISAEDLSASLNFLASDYFEGRGPGTKGEKLAAAYLANTYKWMGLQPPSQNQTRGNPLENYYQHFQFEANGKALSSQNVVTLIEGCDPILKKEAIIICAHYDHLGLDKGLSGDQVFNGAADDGSGTVALLHIAKSFVEAKKKGQGPGRSILLLHTGSEEAGIQGSFYYTNHAPIWPLEKTVAVINMDGVAGFDTSRLPGNFNYVYLLKIDSTSSPLHEKVRQINQTLGINLELKTPSNPKDFNSDNSAFEAQLIPSLYFSTGITEHYHKVSDEAATIDYEHMAKIVKLVFATSWSLANTVVLSSKFNRNQYEKTGKYYCKPCGCSEDDTVFDNPGLCHACQMQLLPVWRKI